jgi:hypothetical protein
MAVVWCPQCKLPLTEEEARPGACPVCRVALPGVLPPTSLVARPTAPAEEESSNAVLWFAIAGLSICALGLILWFSGRAAQQPAEVQTAEASVPARPPSERRTETVPTERKPEPEVLQVAPEEVKPAKPKPSNAKKEDPKPVEPKKPGEPKPIVKKPEDPKPAVNPRMMALRLLDNDAIKIDGDLADWKDIPPVVLTAVERGKSPKKVVAVPRGQKAYIAYCTKGILIAVDVFDSSGELENQPKPQMGMWPFWDNDAVEVYIDTLNLRPRERGESSVHQFFAFPFGMPNDEGIGGYESKIVKNKAGRIDWSIVPHANTGEGAMLRAGKHTPAGWTLELLIPKAALRHAEFKAGTTIGFELQIDTGTNVYGFWLNDDPRVHVSTSPHLWGEAVLGGARPPQGRE